MHKIINLPNLLSLARIALTPLFIWLFFGGIESQILAIIIFTIAALTDCWDGYFARKNKIVSKFGTFIDPLADKVLVISAFSIFAYQQIIGWWVVLTLILRDIFVTQMRIKLLKSGRSLETSYIAKLKTFFQFIGIYLLFVQSLLHGLLTEYKLGLANLFVTYFIYGLVLFSIYTCVDYVIQYLKSTKQFTHNHKFNLFYLISTFFYVGLCPLAPGTACSLVSIILIYFLPTHSIVFNITTSIFLLFVGIITAGHMERKLAIHDPNWAVIDEVLGMFLTVCWMPKNLIVYAIAFVLFRFFDIIKPFPIKHIETIKAPGWGIMLDDVAAAAYASIIGFIILKAFSLFYS